MGMTDRLIALVLFYGGDGFSSSKEKSLVEIPEEWFRKAAVLCMELYFPVADNVKQILDVISDTQSQIEFTRSGTGC